MFEVVATNTVDNEREIITSAYLVTKEKGGTLVKYTAICTCCGQLEHRTRWYSAHWRLEFDPKKRSTGGRQTL